MDSNYTATDPSTLSGSQREFTSTITPAPTINQPSTQPPEESTATTAETLAATPIRESSFSDFTFNFQAKISPFPSSTVTTISFTPPLSSDLLSRIPNEIYILILSWMQPSKLVKMSLVCKTWKVMVDEHFLWKEITTKCELGEPMGKIRSMKDLVLGQLYIICEYCCTRTPGYSPRLPLPIERDDSFGKVWMCRPCRRKYMEENPEVPELEDVQEKSKENNQDDPLIENESEAVPATIEEAVAMVFGGRPGVRTLAGSSSAPAESSVVPGEPSAALDSSTQQVVQQIDFGPVQGSNVVSDETANALTATAATSTSHEQEFDIEAEDPNGQGFLRHLLDNRQSLVHQPSRAPLRNFGRLARDPPYLSFDTDSEFDDYIDYDEDDDEDDIEDEFYGDEYDEDYDSEDWTDDDDDDDDADQYDNWLYHQFIRKLAPVDLVGVVMTDKLEAQLLMMRTRMMKTMMNLFNLEIRSDSGLCNSYLAGQEYDPKRIAMTLKEMEWYFSETDYESKMRLIGDSGDAKEESLIQWAKAYYSARGLKAENDSSNTKTGGSSKGKGKKDAHDYHYYRSRSGKFGRITPPVPCQGEVLENVLKDFKTFAFVKHPPPKSLWSAIELVLKQLATGKMDEDQLRRDFDISFEVDCYVRLEDNMDGLDKKDSKTAEKMSTEFGQVREPEAAGSLAAVASEMLAAKLSSTPHNG